jgi:hypothetical protein
MAWEITLAGDCPAGQEHDLAEQVGEVVDLFGVTASQMRGLTVNGPIHGTAPLGDQGHPSGTEALQSPEADLAKE